MSTHGAKIGPQPNNPSGYLPTTGFEPCTLDPELFFPGPGQSGDRAAAICAQCPLAPACLEYALENDITDGVWGGMTPKERENLKRRRTPLLPGRSPGRPRREPVYA